VYESFLEALLDDVFGVLPDAGETSRNGKNLSLVMLDEHFKCGPVPTFGGKDERRFFILSCEVPPSRIRKLL
jgi:hypothetical protein